ncbi:MAG TPA: DUF6599 family protein [Thermodesulfovibrionales bacterium]|nr:DUF6599 family protein [Thermodesulfovibrionales bacterium]
MHSVPLRYRLVLIGILPIVAGVLYFRGQQYDPALIDFKAATPSQSVASLSTPQPIEKPQAFSAVQELAGFRQLGEQHRYTKDNLYEHVDGHAEYFISAGFQALTVTEYSLAGSNPQEASIEAEVFDMGKSIQAFGVLSDESGENPSSVPVGTMGYKTSGGINFIKGRYYVKIAALNPKAPLLKFSKALAESLPSGQDSFQVFSKFPNLGKVDHTKFVKEGYRGLDFLHNVIERQYSMGDRKVQVALMAASEREVNSLRSSFLDYFKRSGMPNEKIERNGIEAYKVIDKYEGDWFLIPSGDSLFGLFGTDDEAVLRYFMKESKSKG